MEVMKKLILAVLERAVNPSGYGVMDVEGFAREADTEPDIIRKHIRDLVEDGVVQIIKVPQSEFVIFNLSQTKWRKVRKGGKKIRRKRKPTERELIGNKLVGEFSDMSGLRYDSRNTSFAAYNKLWRNPLLALYDLSGGDYDATVKLISDTIRNMRKDKLTISSPRSIEAVARSLWAQYQSGGSSVVRML